MYQLATTFTDCATLKRSKKLLVQQRKKLIYHKTVQKIPTRRKSRTSHCNHFVFQVQLAKLSGQPTPRPVMNTATPPWLLRVPADNNDQAHQKVSLVEMEKMRKNITTHVKQVGLRTEESEFVN